MIKWGSRGFREFAVLVTPQRQGLLSAREDSGIRPVPVGRRPDRRTVDIENPVNNPTDGK